MLPLLTISIPAVCYLVASVHFAWERNIGMAVVFGAYAVANIGLYIATRQ
jgi:hypothetical protein